MKKLLLALALLLAPAAASAQCNGIFPNNTVCGNATGASNTPRATSPATFQGSAGGTNGQIQYNNNGVLGGLTDAQVTARIALFGALSGAVPAPSANDLAGNSGLNSDGTWHTPKPNLAFVVPAPLQSTANLPSSFVSAVAPVWSSGTSGPGSVRMSIRPAALFHLIAVNAGINDLYAYVAPVSGTDTGSTCALATPCKTLQYCIQNCTATNIMGLVEGQFNPFTYDSTATPANLFHRLTFNGAATIKLSGTPYVPPSAMTFAAVGGSPAVYFANLAISGNQAVHRITNNTQFNAGTGTNFRLTQYPNLAALQVASNANPSGTQGWFYDPAGHNLYISYFGANINGSKTNFSAYYVDANGNSWISLVGGVTLLVDSPYQLNLDGVAFDIANSSTNYPTLLIDGRASMLVRAFVSPWYGTHVQGGFLYVDGMDCEASRFDCWNGDPANVGSVTGMMIASNIRGWFAGDNQNYQLLSPTANTQGWSAHGGMNDIIAGASFGQNYGQAIANISNGGYSSYSWFIGVETYLSQSPVPSPGINIFSNDGIAPRTAWIDTCSTQQSDTSLTVQSTAGFAKVTNCSFNVPPNANTGGVITTYTRNAP